MIEARLPMPPDSCAGIIFFKAGEAGELDEIVDLPLAVGARIAFGTESEADVFLDGEPGKELALLRHVADLGVDAAHLFTLEKNPAGGAPGKDRRSV